MIHTFFHFVGLAFVPAALWLFIYYKKDKIEPEPLRLVWHCFYYGMIGAIPLVLLQFVVKVDPSYEPLSLIWGFTGSAIAAYIVLFIIVAVVEEYLKHLGITLIDIDNPHDINQVVDGIVYGVAAAAGFAFIENMLYFFRAVGSGLDGMELTWVFIIRALGATLAHTLFSGTFGYFYAKAKLLPYIRKEQREPLYKFIKHLPRAIKLHIIRTHLLIGRPSRHRHHAAELVAEGFWLAVFLHFSYDMWVNSRVFGANFTPLVIPAIYLGFFYLTRAFLSAADTQVVRSVKERVFTFLTYPELRANIVKKKHFRL